MGRTPTPTSLKLLKGNPGHRKIDTLHEPTPEIGLGEPPPHLDAEAKKLWFELGPQLVKLKTLGKSDAHLFGTLCQAHSRNVWLSSRIDSLRGKKKMSGKEENRLLTYESQRSKAAAQFHKLAADFGLGAASRTRIRVSFDDGQTQLPGIGEDEPESPLARAMRGARATA